MSKILELFPEIAEISGTQTLYRVNSTTVPAGVTVSQTLVDEGYFTTSTAQDIDFVGTAFTLAKFAMILIEGFHSPLKDHNVFALGLSDTDNTTTVAHGALWVPGYGSVLAYGNGSASQVFADSHLPPVKDPRVTTERNVPKTYGMALFGAGQSMQADGTFWLTADRTVIMNEPTTGLGKTGLIPRCYLRTAPTREKVFFRSFEVLLIS